MATRRAAVLAFVVQQTAAFTSTLFARVPPRPPLLVAASPTTARALTPTALLQWPELPAASFLPEIYGQFLYSASGWTIILACLVLAIAQTFEAGTHAVKRAVPANLLPVVNAVLSEVSVLGFSGLVIGTLGINNEEGWLGHISETFLGQKGAAYELFESVDGSIFPVTMAFIATSVALVTLTNRHFDEVCGSTLADALNVRVAEEDARVACDVTGYGSDACRESVSRTERLRNVKINGLRLSSFAIDGTDGVRTTALGPFKDLFAPNAKRRAEFLRFRARFIEQTAEWGVDKDFAFGKYLQASAAQTLAKLVVVEPVQLVKVWVPIAAVEILALGGLGWLDDGEFLPRMVCVSQLPVLVWALWNYSRLWTIKAQLLPQVGRIRVGNDDGGDAAPADVACRLLPPKYTLLRNALTDLRVDDAYGQIAVLEALYQADPTSEHEALFGKLGKNGPTFYLNSMKLVLFSAIVSLAFVLGGGAAGPAAEAAAAVASALGASGADADALIPQLTALATCLAFAPPAIAVALAPSTLLCYNWATAVEDLKRRSLVESVVREQRSERFRSTLGSLVALSEWAENGLAATDTAWAAPPVSAPAAASTGGVAVAVAPVASKVCAGDAERRWSRLVETTPVERLLDVLALFDAQARDCLAIEHVYDGELMLWRPLSSL